MPAPVTSFSGHRPEESGGTRSYASPSAHPAERKIMALQRMDNVLIVVEDLEAAIAFFTELGMELEGRTTVEGEWVDRIIAIDGSRSDIAVMLRNLRKARKARETDERAAREAEDKDVR
jgi:hypothetical protein